MGIAEETYVPDRKRKIILHIQDIHISFWFLRDGRGEAGRHTPAHAETVL